MASIRIGRDDAAVGSFHVEACAPGIVEIFVFFAKTGHCGIAATASCIAVAEKPARRGRDVCTATVLEAVPSEIIQAPEPRWVLHAVLLARSVDLLVARAIAGLCLLVRDYVRVVRGA